MSDIENLSIEEFHEMVALYGRSAATLILAMQALLETLQQSGSANTEELDYSSGEAMKASIERLLHDAIEAYKLSAEAARL